VKSRIQIVRLLRRVRLNAMRLLRIAAILALVGLGLIVWSLLDPRPIPIMVAMSVAQGIGTLSFVIFLAVLLEDAWRANRKRKSERDNEEVDRG
jgi:hypothetical protein